MRQGLAAIPAWCTIAVPRAGAPEPLKMALSATIYTFGITLNDADRSVYEALDFRIARHPSESPEYLVARVLAYCLQYRDGLAFSKGLSDADVPALTVHDMTGLLTSWIEVGTPEAPRLHKAAKTAGRVVVYPHKDAAAWLARLAAESIHRAREIEIYAIDRELLAALATCLQRRMQFDLAISEQHLYLTLAAQSLDGAVVRHVLDNK